VLAKWSHHFGGLNSSNKLELEERGGAAGGCSWPPVAAWLLFAEFAVVGWLTGKGSGWAVVADRLGAATGAWNDSGFVALTFDAGGAKGSACG
jgi:hypothetical protein